MKQKVKEVSIFVPVIYAILAILCGFLIIKCINLSKDVKVLSDRFRTQYNIDVCMQEALDNYSSVWTAYCEMNNIKVTDGNCMIPSNIGEEYNESLKNDKQLCVDRYTND